MLCRLPGSDGGWYALLNGKLAKGMDMAQIKIYGLREQLAPVTRQFSDIIHDCALEALQLPREKRFHRFILLAEDEFFFPEDRSSRYTIIEISMFEGRSVDSKKQLLRLLFTKLQEGLQSPEHASFVAELQKRAK